VEEREDDSLIVSQILALMQSPGRLNGDMDGHGSNAVWNSGGWWSLNFELPSGEAAQNVFQLRRR
jgi:hypothetical protein